MATTTGTRDLRLGIDRLPGGEIAVCVHGKLDGTTAEALREVLRELETSHSAHVVVVGSGIESIDREGVGVLVAVLRRLRLQNRDLYVTMPSGTVFRALRAMNLHRVLLTGGRLPMNWSDPCLPSS